MGNLQKAQDFFENFSQKKADEFWVLAQSGSQRINYFAACANQKFIVTSNKNLRENGAFIYFSEVFSGLNLSTPRILKVSDDGEMYVQEFLGQETLSEIIEKEGLTENVKLLVKQSLQKLYDFQQKTAGQLDFSQTFEYESYGELAILHDLNYFKFMFADVLGAAYHKSVLLREFQKIADEVQSFQPKALIIRDFQARNIIVNTEKKVFFIDYQSAMEGPALYDAVSFLYQAKAGFPEQFRHEMLHLFISKFPELHQEKLWKSVDYIVLLRLLQVLGAYGFRGLVQRKAHFMASIEKGLQNIENFAKTWGEMHRFPELKNVIFQLKDLHHSYQIG